MDKFGIIKPGYTPARDQEKTIEELDTCLEKRASDCAEKRRSSDQKPKQRTEES